MEPKTKILSGKGALPTIGYLIIALLCLAVVLTIFLTNMDSIKSYILEANTPMSLDLQSALECAHYRCQHAEGCGWRGLEYISFPVRVTGSGGTGSDIKKMKCSDFCTPEDVENKEQKCNKEEPIVNVTLSEHGGLSDTGLSFINRDLKYKCIIIRDGGSENNIGYGPNSVQLDSYAMSDRGGGKLCHLDPPTFLGGKYNPCPSTAFLNCGLSYVDVHAGTYQVWYARDTNPFSRKEGLVVWRA